MLDENGHLMYFIEHPPEGNPVYAHSDIYFAFRFQCMWCLKYVASEFLQFINIFVLILLFEI